MTAGVNKASDNQLETNVERRAEPLVQHQAEAAPRRSAPGPLGAII